MKTVYMPQKRVSHELHGMFFWKWESVGLYKTARAAYDRLYKEQQETKVPMQVTVEYITDGRRIEYEEDKENNGI